MLHHKLITEIAGDDRYRPIHSYLLKISDKRLIIVTTDVYKQTKLQLVSIMGENVIHTDKLLFSNTNLILTHVDTIDDEHICVTTYDIDKHDILICTYSVKDCVFTKIDSRAISAYGILNLKNTVISDTHILIHYVMYNDHTEPYLKFIVYEYSDTYELTYRYSYTSKTIASISYIVTKLKDNKICVLYSEIATSRLCLDILLVDNEDKQLNSYSSFCIVDEMVYNMAMVVLNDEHVLLYYTHGFITGHNVLVLLRINGTTITLKDIEYDDSANYHTTLSYDILNYVLYICGSKYDSNSIGTYVSYVRALGIVAELSIPGKILTSEDRCVKHISSTCTNDGKFIVFKCLNDEPYSLLSVYELKEITSDIY